MRSERGRKKKLIVAFHFQLANEQFAGRTGWDCDSCRKHGLEVSRRCGFIAPERRAAAHVVWGRKQVHTEECPRSLVTGESQALLEEFFVQRGLALPPLAGLTGEQIPARKVDAFLILQYETEREQHDATTQP